MLAQILVVVLDPLGRAEQRLLLAIPCGVDQRPLRAPSLLCELAKRARFLEDDRHAGTGITRTVDPRVVVVAANHPFVRIGRPLHPRDDVVNRHAVPVECELQVHTRRAGTEVIGDRQRAAPRLGDDGAAQRREQGLRVGVRDGQHGNLRQRRHVLDVETLRAGRCADTGRQRIARIRGHVHHASPLDAAAVARGTVRKRVVGVIAVIHRVRVDQTADRTVLGGDLRLDTAPGIPVTRDDDRPSHRDTAAIEIVVVLRAAVVDVHDWSRHVAVNRIGIERRQLLCLLA